MRALVREVYGNPDVLRIAEVPKPCPGPGELLVKVHAASVAKADWEILRGKPVWVKLSGFGLFRPKAKILGYNFAGRVEGVGPEVSRFNLGDEIFGDTLLHGLGAFAEWLCVPQDAAITTRPPGLSPEAAACLPESGLIALQALRDHVDLQPGQRVLINGAGGGTGTLAIQLAKIRGTEVTAVDHTAKFDRLRALGADHVLDFMHADFNLPDDRYDLILDIVGVGSLRRWRRSLRAGGVYLTVGGSIGYLLKTLLLGGVSRLCRGKRVRVFALRHNVPDLVQLADLALRGEVTPVIDRRYTLDQTAEAISYVGAGRSIGKLVITP
ncbi:Phenolphthiocerol synthesis polyketide synthase type I Pks15/1 [Botrimarina hoheduenensis]|uniref:Phenolphthiocerol synthesis polyketide synthase type I Pks15/1 n=2 Tax=Botrimarina hoheduenensis TaxID=2528000 RepID=A0A5C5WBK6_9BACT|nr:Phenolphthiocerol synthesis polyketide synthase type I Pks15/1 [Botrimarina hoheduenensis]